MKKFRLFGRLLTKSLSKMMYIQKFVNNIAGEETHGFWLANPCNISGICQVMLANSKTVLPSGYG